jgi:hypothetical protein
MPTFLHCPILLHLEPIFQNFFSAKNQIPRNFHGEKCKGAKFLYNILPGLYLGIHTENYFQNIFREKFPFSQTFLGGNFRGIICGKNAPKIGSRWRAKPAKDERKRSNNFSSFKKLKKVNQLHFLHGPSTVAKRDFLHFLSIIAI